MYNKVILIGHLGADAEVRYSQGGETAILKFKMATNQRWRDKSGEWKEETQWHSIVHFTKFADRKAERLKKGALVFVDGDIRYSTWDDKDGITHYQTDIRAFKVTPLTPREVQAGDFEQSEFDKTESKPKFEDKSPASTKEDSFGVDDDMPF